MLAVAQLVDEDGDPNRHAFYEPEAEVLVLVLAADGEAAAAGG